MKKIVFSLMLFMGSLFFAQEYYDTYPQYSGDEYYNDNYDYPEDYYYNYPNDYYPNGYYESYYNDYAKSISMVNWNRFFFDYKLAPWQIDQIIALNNRFPSYGAWSMYYGMNPDRWYYDRFFALQNILGPRLFVVYQNSYYRGNPIVYFQNYRRNYYVVHYHVVPKYRYVNVSNYRLDRNNFRQYYQNNRLNGMLNTNQSSAGIRNNQHSGFRNDVAVNNNGGFRNDNSIRTSSVRDNNGGGFRSDNAPTGGIKPPANNNSNVRTNDNSGFRTNTPRNAPRVESNSNTRSNNGGGFRGGR